MHLNFSGFSIINPLIKHQWVKLSAFALDNVEVIFPDDVQIVYLPSFYSRLYETLIKSVQGSFLFKHSRYKD